MGEIALLQNVPRTATVVATTPMRMLVAGPAAATTFLDTPAVARLMVAGLSARLRRASVRASPGAAVSD